MAKRLVRIFNGQLEQRTNELTDRPISVILKSGNTVFGQFEKTENHLLFVKDGRFHQHILAFTQIEEVIYDQSVGF